MKQHFGKYIGPMLVDEKEPITAWRVWRINDRGKRPLLHGSWNSPGRTWLPQVATIAECLAKNPCHINDGQGLRLRPLGLQGDLGPDRSQRRGALSDWRARACVALGLRPRLQYGFRAQLGRPRDLWLGNTGGADFADRLHRAYRVPISVGLPMELIATDGGLVARPSLEPDHLAPVTA